MRARVYVTLKREVLDPQGEAVRKGLHALGIDGVKDVRVGKLIEVELDAPEGADVNALLESAASRLLANPVIEDYAIERVELKTA